MTESPKDKLRRYASLNEKLLQLIKQPGWTPANFALIISGIEPVPGCTDIPERGMLLEDLSQPATTKEFKIARWVLKEWLETHFDYFGRGEPSPDDVLRTEKPPVDYLAWLVLDAELPLLDERPRLVDQVLTLWREPEYALQAIPSDIVDRAQALEHHAAIELERQQQGRPSASEATEPASGMAGGEYVRRIPIGASKAGKKPAIGAEIREAQDRQPDLHQKLDPDAVWWELIRMAEDRFGRLRGVHGDNLIYLSKIGELKYHRSALSQYLTACRERLEQAKLDPAVASRTILG